jgi:hypothetical protein
MECGSRIQFGDEALTGSDVSHAHYIKCSILTYEEIGESHYDPNFSFKILRGPLKGFF